MTPRENYGSMCDRNTRSGIWHRADVNHYLKWAFREAAEACCQHRERPHWKHRHVSRLYARVRHRKDHARAIGAVARHLAEATYWILTKEASYQDPTRKTDASTKA